jgi:hypothetical protein
LTAVGVTGAEAAGSTAGGFGFAALGLAAAVRGLVVAAADFALALARLVAVPSLRTPLPRRLAPVVGGSVVAGAGCSAAAVTSSSPAKRPRTLPAPGTALTTFAPAPSALFRMFFGVMGIRGAYRPRRCGKPGCGALRLSGSRRGPASPGRKLDDGPGPAPARRLPGPSGSGLGGWWARAAGRGPRRARFRRCCSPLVSVPELVRLMGCGPNRPGAGRSESGGMAGDEPVVATQLGSPSAIRCASASPPRCRSAVQRPP